MAKRKPSNPESSDPQQQSSSRSCEWNANGLRCRYPGTISPATNGGGPWYCSLHFDCRNAAFGQSVLEASQSWQPSTKEEEAARFDREVKQWLAEHDLRGSRQDVLDLVHKLARKMTSSPTPNLDWAHRILARVAAGEQLPAISIQKARAALQAPDTEA